MMNMRIFAAFGALGLSLALAPAAFAYTVSADYLNVMEEPSAPAQSMVYQGETLELVSYDLREVEADEVMVPFTKWFEKEVRPADLEATLASVPATVEVDEDGYRGEIALTNKTYRKVEATESAQVDVSKVYTGLATNEQSLIEQSILFDTEWTQGLELKLAYVSWEVTATDTYGRPTQYKATALYRGVDSHVVIDHYVVRAEYAGDVPAVEQPKSYKLTATYEAPAAAAAETDTNAANSANAQDSASLPFAPYLPIALGAAAAAAVGGGLIVIKKRKERFRITQELEGKEVLVCAPPIRQDAGRLRVELPAGAPVAWGAGALRGYAPAKWVRRGAELLVYAVGAQDEARELYAGPALDCVPLRWEAC